MPSIAQFILNDQRFETLVKAAQVAGLEQPLSAGEYTLFAAPDSAFETLPPDLLDRLMKDPRGLYNILATHVVEGKLTAANLTKREAVKTLQGARLDISKMGKHIYVADAQIVQADILADNGVIHIIDIVMLPL